MESLGRVYGCWGEKDLKLSQEVGSEDTRMLSLDGPCALVTRQSWSCSVQTTRSKGSHHE